MTAGAVLLRAAARAGYYGLMIQLFGPQVRGGEAAALVQVSTEPVLAQPDRFDVFVALDWKKVDQFAPEIPLDATSIILADPVSGPVPAAMAKSKARVLPLTLHDPDATRLDRFLHPGHANVLAAGVVAALAGFGLCHLRAAINDVLGDKGAKVVETNLASALAGAEAAPSLSLDLMLDAATASPRWLISGNEAIALGALRGGVRFVGCYPITPATDLVEWLAPELQKLGGKLVIAEDELAAINMVLGASYGGVPAMTVTSGPGFALMTEAIGLGVAAEIPAVIIDVMRAGPSTGIPSKTEQSDIDIAIHGGHGDAPRVVLAPLSIADCIPTAERAVELAEELQLPVIVLSDQALGQGRVIIDPPKECRSPRVRRTNGVVPGTPFKRYAIGPSAVTSMPPPGMPGGQWIAEGLTHNELGIPVSGAGAHVAQLNKRAKKLEGFEPGDLWGRSWGDGEIAIITFGSGVGPARAAAARLSASGRPARVIGLRQLSPVPKLALARLLRGVRRVIVVEQNHGAQLYQYLLGQKAIPATAETLARPGPLPFRPAEIAAHVA
jgi:2-oxoglutarate ferredoxin oxidoreductase subunit alpha